MSDFDYDDDDETVLIQRRNVVILEEEHIDKWDLMINALEFYREYGIPEGTPEHDKEWDIIVSYVHTLTGIIFGINRDEEPN